MSNQQPQLPATPQAVGTLNIPPISMPLCTRVWAKSPWTDKAAKITAGEPVLWQYDMPHPFVSAYKIVRMYVVAGGAVEVFSSDAHNPGGGVTGLQHIIPWHEVQMVEHAMDAKTFIEEMTAAEEGDDDEEDEEDDEEDEEDEEADKPLPAGSDVGNVPLAPVNGAGGQS